MREVDAILSQFPGPVMLTIGPRKKLLALALFLPLTLFCAWLVIAGSAPQWRAQDNTMAWVGTVVFGFLSIAALLLLLIPSGASLTLDAEGFQISSPFQRVRYAWRDVSGFRIERTGIDWYPAVTFEVPPGGAAQRRGATRVTTSLPDNYSLPRDDLVWLMDAWRQRALARP